MHQALARDEKTIGDEGVKTPRSELTRLREEETQGDPEVRVQIMDAMLLCCGEVGYRRVAVERVYKRYGGYRSQFYRHFRNKGHCYLAAYEAESDRLLGRLTSYTGKPEEDGLTSALEELAHFIIEDPLRAKAVFVEVHVAGGEALDKRYEVMRRLSHALDSGCREKDSRHSPPPLTAEFMISAIDQALQSALLASSTRDFLESLPDLATLVRHAYRDENEPLV